MLWDLMYVPLSLYVCVRGVSVSNDRAEVFTAKVLWHITGSIATSYCSKCLSTHTHTHR